MLRSILCAAALFAATQTAVAHGGRFETHVIHAEPRLALSFGSLWHDGFNVTYEVGGPRHPVYSAPVIVVPPMVRHREIIHEDRHGHRRWGDGRRHGWSSHDGRGHRHGRH